uniref:Uncharacterized protein n=1 Tax=viral metagenome TaxID=1070528 RepID=A0A6C0K2J3_9ZZZZ
MPEKLNIHYILYTAFRLSPFIIVSFFTLSSILNQDLKGVIYLAGLLFTSFFAVILGSIFKLPDIVGTEENIAVCNSLTLTDSGALSKIPLGMVVFSYTFFYLVDIIAEYNLAMQNIPTLVLFPVLIITEAIWNYTNHCTNFARLFSAFAIGSLCGFIWARIIRSTGAVQLQYFNGINNAQTCSRPSKQKFKCTINK